MTDRANELEAFKALDLRAYAADAFGFELDPKRSSPNSSLMRSPDGRKIVVSIGLDSHFQWFEVGGDAGGSIIDLAQVHGVGSLGQVRKALRPYIGRSTDIPLRSSFPKLHPVERDIAAVRAAWEAMRPLANGQHTYLNEERGLPPALLASPRFALRLRSDERGNAAWAHLNRDGLCGFELKNRGGFTAFSKHGAKGLFASMIQDTDTELVVAESAIDAASHAALFPSPTARYVSLAGQVSPEQLDLLEAAMIKLPRGTVVLAFDNDQAGRDLTTKSEEVFRAVGREEQALRVDVPPVAGRDWNDMLRERLGAPPPEPA